MNRLLSNVFNSIKDINWLRKEINRLLHKEMSNIYLKVTIETFSKFQFSRIKKLITNMITSFTQINSFSCFL